MAQRRTLDPSELQGMVEVSQGQEKGSGFSPTTDPKFPLMRTPVNKSILVYIPRTNVIQTGTLEDGQTPKEEMQVLKSLIHEVNRGRYTEKHRCVSGLQGTPAADILGYDGQCPLCEATTHVWELYNLQMEAKAKAKGLPSVDADTADILKEDRKKVLAEREVMNAEEYVTFTIVIIPSENNQPTPTALEDMTPVFVQWRSKRYQDKLIKALSAMYSKPQHLGGLFMLWDFTYDTQGKQANARDSAQNATYTIIQDAGALQALEVFRAKAEEIAKEFTLLKAAEVIISNQFLYKDDLEKMATQFTKKTVQLIEMSKMAGGQPMQGLPMQGLPQQGANPLANFGGMPTSQMGVEQQPMQQPMQQQPMQQQPMQQQPMQQQPVQQPQPTQQGEVSNPLFTT